MLIWCLHFYLLILHFDFQEKGQAGHTVSAELVKEPEVVHAGSAGEVDDSDQPAGDMAQRHVSLAGPPIRRRPRWWRSRRHT